MHNINNVIEGVYSGLSDDMLEHSKNDGNTLALSSDDEAQTKCIGGQVPAPKKEADQMGKLAAQTAEIVTGALDISETIPNLQNVPSSSPEFQGYSKESQHIREKKDEEQLPQQLDVGIVGSIEEELKRALGLSTVEVCFSDSNCQLQ